MSACLLFAVQAEGHEITTLSGLAALAGADTGGEAAAAGAGTTAVAGTLHPLQERFLRKGALQCGFCTPGMVLTSYALVERVGSPTREEVAYELVGNLCRCTGYAKIFEAVADYAASRHVDAAERDREADRDERDRP